MIKPFILIILLLGVGIFMLPKDVFFAQEPTANCCQTESKAKKCCAASEKPSPCQDAQNKSHSCDGQCNHCSVNTFSAVFIAEQAYCSPIKILPSVSQKVENIYLNPQFSSLSKAIWQPPKIG